MARRMGIEVSIGCSEAVTLADVDVIAAYPITPQTHIVEHLSEQVADGHLDCEYIKVESEQSAMSCCMGASAAGARTFTATASQGLALMSEMLYIASGLRLPIVMALVTRTMSAPLTIWGDQSDIMSIRDCGWIVAFAENGQEVFDMTLQAFRIAEDERVLNPMIVCLDGFHLSHVIEPIEILDREEVDPFLPAYKPKYRLDPHEVLSMGCFTMPEYFSEIKKQQDEALKGSYPVILEVWKEWEERFGRSYNPINLYRAEDAETVIVIAGAFSGTARLAVDRMREKGMKVGLASLKLWRPFPLEDILRELGGADVVVVVDRALSVGGAGGPIATELRAAFYSRQRRPAIVSFVAGLSGRDIMADQFEEIVEKASRYAKEGDIPYYEMYGVRE
ncbi:MAG: pyruvate ferredoxin oxidoreductase [Actinomycetota bacterium]|nr:pyruvate ferredoxin oxidoreductase [Actinomycetota bacterium]